MTNSYSRFSIGNQIVGDGADVFVIAEVGINHGGDPKLAARLIDEAAQAGASAVKLQTYRAATFLARSSSYFDVLEAAELPEDTIRALMERATARGILLFSSVFDDSSAEMMAGLGTPAFKIASGDLTHTPLIRRVAGFGRPVILSTGGATIAEIDAAVEAVRSAGASTPFALLHCVSNYPTAPEQANLACLAGMRARYGVPVGFSDHTLGTAVAVAAVALGASIIEKHFTYDNSAPGPDHALSADSEAMRRMVEDVGQARRAIGRIEKAPIEAPPSIAAIRRSLVAASPIAAGSRIRADQIAFKRPGTGLPPSEHQRVVGRIARCDIPADTALTEELLS
jgi:N,N'-diacetyllegionaminate synthase